MCMDKGESFPNLHGQLDVTGLAFQIYDAPSGFWVSYLSALESGTKQFFMISLTVHIFICLLLVLSCLLLNLQVVEVLLVICFS